MDWYPIQREEKYSQLLHTAESRAELLEAWLALTSVKYHDNLLILMLFNQWLAITSVKYHDNLLVLMLFNQWLALTSVKYHDNLLILMLFNQWLVPTMLRTAGPRRSLLTCHILVSSHNVSGLVSECDGHGK